jgi:RimJ/RimL family protein N-acetyltransferase
MALESWLSSMQYISVDASLTAISVRPLEEPEWAAFRNLRLQALRTEAGVFASTYEDEASKGPDEWRALIKNPAQKLFGLFDDKRLIGITAVFTWRNDPSGQTAILAMSFILPEYRGRGLARRLYRARLDWVRLHPQFKRVIVSHRESNSLSRRATERQGFVLTGRTQHTWPDGNTEDELHYELKIEIPQGNSGVSGKS